MRAIEIKAEKKYRKKAIFGSILFTLFLVVLFFLVGFTEPDPLPIDIEEVQEIELGGIDIKFDSPAAGGGSPANSTNPNPAPASGLDTPDQEDSEVEVNKGSGKTDKPGNDKPRIDPGLGFPNGLGDGGDGNGSGGGKGDGIGSGSDGYGDGNGGGGTRKLTSGPCVKESGLVPGKVFLILYIDASGKVVRASTDMSKTVGGNKSTYSAVEKGALDCMKFEPRPGTGTQKLFYPKGITVRAQ